MLLSVVPVQAQTTGLSFLRFGANAEAMAMGDAQVAASRGAFASYWNPAGLAVGADHSVSASHRIWVADTRAYTAAARFRVDAKSGVGLFIGAGGNDAFGDDFGESTGFFDIQEFSAGVAYGRRLGPIRAGVAAKYVSESVEELAARGVAFDAGVQYDVPGGLATLGAALQHVGTLSEPAIESPELPRTVRAGAAVYPFRVWAEDDDALILATTFTAEVSHFFPSETTQLHLGAALEVLELLVFRAGYLTDDTLRNATFGAGLRYEPFRVDYAFVPFEDGFAGPGHQFSVMYAW